MEQEEGDSTVISFQEQSYFAPLAGRKNESSNQISGYRQSATFAVWNYGEATVKLSSMLSIDFF